MVPSSHLHEISYLKLPTGPDGENRIVDVNYHGRKVYGPQSVRRLAASSSQKTKAKYNADNYAWFATVCEFYPLVSSKVTNHPLGGTLDSGMSNILPSACG